MNVKKDLKNLVRGWFPEETSSMKRAVSHHSSANKSALILLSFVLVCLLIATTVFLFPMLFTNGEADGWVTSRVVERTSFPGGDIMVQENRQSPSDKGYITMHIEANVTSEKNLEAYITSRTNALNTILDAASADSLIEAELTLSVISP